MAHPQARKVFSVERHELPEDFVFFRILCGVQSLPFVFAPNRACVCMVHYYSGRHRERFCVSGLRSPELSTQVRLQNSCIYCTLAQMDASVTRTGRNG